MLNGSAECSQSLFLGSNRKHGFMLLLFGCFEVLRTLYMLIRQSGVDPEIIKHHSYYCRYIVLLLFTSWETMSPARLHSLAAFCRAKLFWSPLLVLQC